MLRNNHHWTTPPVLSPSGSRFKASAFYNRSQQPGTETYPWLMWSRDLQTPDAGTAHRNPAFCEVKVFALWLFELFITQQLSGVSICDTKSESVTALRLLWDGGQLSPEAEAQSPTPRGSGEAQVSLHFRRLWLLLHLEPTQLQAFCDLRYPH